MNELVKTNLPRCIAGAFVLNEAGKYQSILTPEMTFAPDHLAQYLRQAAGIIEERL